ncbi:tetratricopeptide repeat protein, partial [Gottfriedia sp. NPDC056225]|uniref:tetratricopeptide repeat protein n=1 Tax=Gottfriedia sp. NPDC056225 TaxID=3345751 RepID=UPI0035E2141A
IKGMRSKMNDILLNEFTKLLNRKKWNFRILSKKSKIHYTDISKIFNNKVPLSLHNLDAITEAFQLPKGSFYKMYLNLCFNERHLLDKRRSSSLIYQCAKYGFKSELSYILSVMIKEKSKAIRTKYFQNLFSIAEQLFLDGNEREALPLYEMVIKYMPHSVTEVVAISYFRKFYMTLPSNKGNSHMVHVLEYISYLPDKFQELTILWITASYYFLRQWDEVLHYAKKLEKTTKNEDHLGRALIYQAFALTRLGGDLEDVLNIIEKYRKINDHFAELAAGNRYVALMDSGDLHVVDSYYNWLIKRDNVFIGIPRIIECYVKLGRIKDAEIFIEKHQNQIEAMSNSSNLFIQHLYLDYSYAIGLLKCETNNTYLGIEELLNVALKMKNAEDNEKFRKCLLAIWNYRIFFNKELEEKYMQLLTAINKNSTIYTNVNVSNFETIKKSDNSNYIWQKSKSDIARESINESVFVYSEVSNLYWWDGIAH